MNPKQSNTLHIEMVGEELSVYDWKRLQMHSLSPTAAKVFALCDGKTSPAEISTRADLPEELVWQALDELNKANLLQSQMALPASMSRRQFLKLGSAAAAAAIVSIALPRPAAAQSVTCTTHTEQASAINGQTFQSLPVGATGQPPSQNILSTMTATGSGTVGGVQTNSGTFTTDASGTVTSAVDFGVASGFVAGDTLRFDASGTMNGCDIIEVI